MVTKPEVRALALARLSPGPGLLVWDVGAGSGSVAVECARFGAAVIAVERDPAQCARVTANARRHRAEVRVVGSAAPEALENLPDPDAVFVGGGGLAVISAVAGDRPGRGSPAAVQRTGSSGRARVHGGRHAAAGQPPDPVAGRCAAGAATRSSSLLPSQPWPHPARPCGSGVIGLKAGVIG
jgi:precorrin-6Y C5,15-methyltransferase (decarboxylating)